MFVKIFLKPPRQSFFCLAPGGTGKTTRLKVNFPNALFINLLEPDDPRTYQSKPERLRDAIPPKILLGSRSS